MGRLHLPSELLDEILDHTLPSGIEAFALSCKTAYMCATSHIQRHNALKQQWRCTSVSNDRRAYILGILYEVSCDPLIGQYIESLSLWDREQLSTTSDDEDFLLSEDVKRSIRNLITEPEYFDDAGVDEDEWCEQLWKEYEKGSEEEGNWEEEALYTTVSLLGKLPNLKTL
jgi:hypothetical protein